MTTLPPTQYTPLQQAYLRHYENSRPKLIGAMQQKFRLPRQHAEDLVQQSYLTAWEKLSQCRDPDKFPQWIYTIAQNTTRSYLNRRYNRESQLPENFDKPSTTDAIAATHARLDIERLATRMSDRERQVVLEGLGYGYNSHEIAKKEGITSAGVRVALMRFRRKVT